VTVVLGVAKMGESQGEFLMESWSYWRVGGSSGEGGMREGGISGFHDH
jgi:hypothetical protein